MPQADQGRTIGVVFYGCKAPLNSKGLCARFLSLAIDQTGMTHLAGPWVEELTDTQNPHLNGISALVMIKESHLAIHTWPDDEIVRVLVDSCGEIRDAVGLIGWMAENLRASQYTIYCDSDGQEKIKKRLQD